MTRYLCDGMPQLSGCGDEATPARPFTYPHRPRKSGWLTIPARNEDGTDDLDLLLHFCPSCAVVVRAQEAKDTSPVVLPVAVERGQG